MFRKPKSTKTLKQMIAAIQKLLKPGEFIYVER
jgi:hypothetical protein